MAGASFEAESIAHERCRDEWRALCASGLTLAALQALHTRYKYLVMSRHIDSYRAIGKLLANVDADALPLAAQRCRELMLQALSKPRTRGGDVNALLHIAGYLKQRLTPREKSELLAAIERYRSSEIEFDIPAALLRAHFRRFPNAYIERQIFLYPSAPDKNHIEECR